MTWIDINEKQPEQGMRVLVVIGDFVCEARRGTGLTWYRDGKKLKTQIMGPITHWMPFPSPPHDIPRSGHTYAGCGIE